MTPPFFTIIIPTFNSEKTLQKALDSILSQNFSDFEILIVDGVSNDRTVNIIKTNAEIDKRISFISEKDNGIFDAMNKGIGMTQGTWLYFLGSDDNLYDGSVLSFVFDNLNYSSCNFLYGNIMSDRGLYGGAFNDEKILRKNISHQAIFYKREVFSKMGDYNLKYKTHADWEFNIRCFTSNFISVKYIDLVIAKFAKGGVSSQHEVLFFREILIPEKLKMLNKSGTEPLRKIYLYDEWWRFIRNAKIRTQLEFDNYAQGQITPVCIKNMIKFQQRIPEKMLKTGFFSKVLMLINYLFNKVTNSL
jgi:glycosyltransferase involved in cell wall biosynthesis